MYGVQIVVAEIIFIAWSARLSYLLSEILAELRK